MRKIYCGYSGKEISEEEAKKTSLAEYSYDSPETALNDLIIKGGNMKFYWKTSDKIKEITEPIIHKGVKLESYITYGKHVFLNMMGFYAYVGEMSE